MAKCKVLIAGNSKSGMEGNGGKAGISGGARRDENRVGELRAIGQRDLHVQGLSVAHDGERHRAPWLRLANNVAELIFIFDLIAIEADDHVVLLQTGFSGRCVLVNHRHLGPRGALQLQGLHAIGRDVANIDPKVRPLPRRRLRPVLTLPLPPN